jgi:antibiotic biosynthesis monooxygenase (ABM) superfamily enzyme
MEYEGKPGFGQVTALMVRVVKPHRVNEFEEWVKGINQVVKGFAGYLGTDLIHPRDHAHPEYVIVLRFDEYDNLRAWLGSMEREEWEKRLEGMTIEEIHREAHGFEPCFTLPDRSAAPPPPAKYKMTVLTILALYPPLLALSTLIQFLLHGWPRALLILLTALLLVPTMIYYIMPWMTRLFRSWLYPKTALSNSKRQDSVCLLLS